MGSMFDVPTKPGKKQLNLWVSKETDDALRSLAPKFHLRGRTQLVEVIIENFLRELKDGTTVPELPADIPASTAAPAIKKGADKRKTK